MSAAADAERQIDNERVIVTRWTLPPGAATGPHRHEYDYVVVPVTDGVLVLTDPNGAVSKADLAAGRSYARTAGVEHDVTNGGDAEIVFVEVELR